MQIRGFMLIFDCSPADVESLIVSLADTCITAAKASRQIHDDDNYSNHFE